MIIYVIISGFLSGSIFTPNSNAYSPPNETSVESAGNIQNRNWVNTLIIIVTLLAVLGLFIVCFILYRREKASRRGPGLVSYLDFFIFYYYYFIVY
jgi:heme/copper-type cytochrome/quinol oxidase subunit 2